MLLQGRDTSIDSIFRAVTGQNPSEEASKKSGRSKDKQCRSIVNLLNKYHNQYLRSARKFRF